MLAYLFWHRPHDPAAVEDYEQAQVSFHRSLARKPPVGLCGSAVFRVAELPWRATHGAEGEDAATASQPAYEDWYLVEDFAALGVLNEAAVGRGHRTAHDDLARRAGAGSGGLYALLEGDRSKLGLHAAPLGEASLAIWVERPPGSRTRMLAELLGDGMDPRHSSLWRRQLVLGAAPEFCLLAPEAPPGAAPTRLPEGWTARALERETLWSG
ncbi:MAG: hypothetical protein JWL67_2371 [Solirubrobacterales bacterium]|nr:hypothetical protein [Solirubrobacterales bacterium]